MSDNKYDIDGDYINDCHYNNITFDEFGHIESITFTIGSANTLTRVFKIFGFDEIIINLDIDNLNDKSDINSEYIYIDTMLVYQDYVKLSCLPRNIRVRCLNIRNNQYGLGLDNYIDHLDGVNFLNITELQITRSIESYYHFIDESICDKINNISMLHKICFNEIHPDEFAVLLKINIPIVRISKIIREYPDDSKIVRLTSHLAINVRLLYSDRAKYMIVENNLYVSRRKAKLTELCTICLLNEICQDKEKYIDCVYNAL
jgi:hypothetical protein